MKKITTFIAGVSIIVVSVVTANAGDIPPVLKAGFEQYIKKGPKAAIESWAKGSAIEGNKETLSQANNFQQIQDFYGNIVGYNVVMSKNHSSSSSVYLIEIKYEKGNVFSKFFIYKTPDGQQVLTTFLFNIDAERVWPEYLVLGPDGQ